MVIDRGLTVPEDILAMAPFTPKRERVTKSTGTSAMLTSGEVQNLVAALQVHGKVVPHDAELVVESLMAPPEVEAPLHASVSFKHVSDGPGMHASA